MTASISARSRRMGCRSRSSGLLRTPFRPNPVHQALLRGERLIHIADQAAVETDTSIARASVDAGARTLLVGAAAQG